MCFRVHLRKETYERMNNGNVVSLDSRISKMVARCLVFN